jgi:hypothetical protein
MNNNGRIEMLDPWIIEEIRKREQEEREEREGRRPELTIELPLPPSPPPTPTTEVPRGVAIIQVWKE